MKLKVLYFASLREALGSAEELVEVPPGIASVAALRGFLAAGGWRAGAGGRPQTFAPR